MEAPVYTLVNLDSAQPVWSGLFLPRQAGETVNDFAALLSDGSIHAYLSHAAFDLDGIQPQATALMLNGIAMELCGSSRPASGSEHLISHALDTICARPRLHGLQVCPVSPDAGCRLRTRCRAGRSLLQLPFRIPHRHWQLHVLLR